jgi:ring-1,2-phenylacetyl-CoA epoxidase subunit PaaD
VVEQLADPWAVLRGIPDPEIPVISIVELGIVREVIVSGSSVEVAITPTYSGCPALHAIEEDIGARLRESGYSDVRVTQQLSPAWTTDWMEAGARERLREYGIVPPHPVRGADSHRIHIFSRGIACPRCGSENTEVLSEFGSTACKALYRCIDCREPFDYFKPL